MNALIPFDFDQHAVRVLKDDNGDPWFVARDVADVLGYSDAYEMIKKLDDDEKSNRQIAGLGSPTGGRGTALINEAGLYSVILTSQKPEAKPFKRWVTHEVLPAIRQTGSYQSAAPLKQSADAAKAFPSFFRVARLLGCDKNAAAISANQMVLSLSRVDLLAGLGQKHLEAANQETQFFTPTELGQRIESSGRNVNLLLAEAGMQAKFGKEWEVTDAGREFSRIYDTGKKHGSGVPVTQIKWAATVLERLNGAGNVVPISQGVA